MCCEESVGCCGGLLPSTLYSRIHIDSKANTPSHMHFSKSIAIEEFARLRKTGAMVDG